MKKLPSLTQNKQTNHVAEINVGYYQIHLSHNQNLLLRQHLEVGLISVNWFSCTNSKKGDDFTFVLSLLIFFY